jgi:hypothetical protein
MQTNVGLELARAGLLFEETRSRRITQADIATQHASTLIDTIGALEQAITAAYHHGEDEINLLSEQLRPFVEQFRQDFPDLADQIPEDGILHKQNAGSFKDALNIEVRKLQQEIDREMTSAKYDMEDIQAVIKMLSDALKQLNRAISEWLSRSSRG